VIRAAPARRRRDVIRAPGSAAIPAIGRAGILTV
jgi:hypothetical protein